MNAPLNDNGPCRPLNEREIAFLAREVEAIRNREIVRRMLRETPPQPQMTGFDLLCLMVGVFALSWFLAALIGGAA